MAVMQRMFPLASLGATNPQPLGRPIAWHRLTFRALTADEIARGVTAKCLTCGQVFLDADDTAHPCPGPRR